jgi:hypothetical protein
MLQVGSQKLPDFSPCKVSHKSSLIRNVLSLLLWSELLGVLLLPVSPESAGECLRHACGNIMMNGTSS